MLLLTNLCSVGFSLRNMPAQAKAYATE